MQNEGFNNFVRLLGVDVMAFIGSYFDKSNDKQIEFTIVGGVVASVDRWGEFNKQWANVLIDFEIPFFHMTDFENNKDFFKDEKWTTETKHRLLNQLLAIMADKIEFCMASYIEHSEFEAEQNRRLSTLKMEKLTPKMRRLAPYHICTEHSAMFIYKYMLENQHSKDSVICFDRGEKVLTDAIPLYDFQRVHKNVAIKDKKETLPLQAADIYAYEVMKDTLNGSNNNYKKRYPLRVLSEKINMKILQCNSEIIAKYFDAWTEYHQTIA